MNAPSTPRFPLQRLSAAALASGVLLTACGGGGGDGAPGTASSLSQPDATADSANSTSTGQDTAAAMDTVIDTTSLLAQATATVTGVAPQRMQALSTDARADTSPVPPGTHFTVNCGGGGTATLGIAGASAELELNGQLDAGERYTVTYAQCTGQAGQAQLNGSVEMDVTSADHSTSPGTLAVGLTVTGLSLTLPAGSATLNGSATVSRSVTTSGGSTTTTSHVSVPSATLTTAFNSRNGTFTVSNLDATRTQASVAGIVTASQYNGHHTLSGSANGRSFSMSVATTGNVSYDATGALVSGAWTVVRPLATIATTVANGMVIMTVDDGNNGTIDHTWTFPAASLGAAAG